MFAERFSVTVNPILFRSGKRGVTTFLRSDEIVLPQRANEESENR